jgi:hypothetical protein
MDKFTLPGVRGELVRQRGLKEERMMGRKKLNLARRPFQHFCPKPPDWDG